MSLLARSLYIYLCFIVVSCDNGGDCSFNPALACVADYCQPWPCAATGQCVTGQKCSQDAWLRTCVCKAYVSFSCKCLKRGFFIPLKIPFRTKIIIMRDQMIVLNTIFHEYTEDDCRYICYSTAT